VGLPPSSSEVPGARLKTGRSTTAKRKEKMAATATVQMRGRKRRATIPSTRRKGKTAARVVRSAPRSGPTTSAMASRWGASEDPANRSSRSR
jgi:hypothetical protein